MSSSNDNKPVPPSIDRYDHLIPAANRLLKFTAHATWQAIKFLVTTAFRIPGRIRRHAKKESATLSNSPKA